MDDVEDEGISRSSSIAEDESTVRGLWLLDESACVCITVCILH